MAKRAGNHKPRKNLYFHWWRPAVLVKTRAVSCGVLTPGLGHSYQRIFSLTLRLFEIPFSYSSACICSVVAKR